MHILICPVCKRICILWDDQKITATDEAMYKFQRLLLARWNYKRIAYTHLRCKNK